jgi:hypothetical protein
MSDESQGVGWWIASDGKWYPPELHPSQREAPTAPPPTGPDASWPSSSPNPSATTDPSQPGQRWLYAAPDPGTAVGLTGPGGWPVSSSQPATHTGPFGGFPGYDYASSGPPAEQKRRLLRQPLFVGSVVLVVLIVLGGVLVAVVVSSGPSYPTKWNPRVLSIVHFVEHERGLTFVHPVKVEFLDRAQFNKAVSVPQPDSSSDRASETQELQELRALGLVHGNVNLAQSENTLQQSDVVGLYVSSKKTVFVRGSTLTPFVRVTMAHELTHALQDQHFDLTTLRENAAGDGSAVTALIEGDAVRVQNAYEQTMSVADQHAYEKASDQFDGNSSSQTSNVPAFLGDTLEYPYAFGPTFIDNLVAQGGTKDIDNAFRHPPVAQAQIIDPVAYPIGWKPDKVPTPSIPHGDHVTDPASPFGQLTLFEVLGSRLGFAPAWSAVQGWQGDTSVAYRDHGKTCDAIAVRMRTTTRASALAGAAHQWAATGVPQAAIDQNGRQITIRSCDPGPNASKLPNIKPAAFDVLAARAQLIDGLMTEGHVGFALGACVSDEVLQKLGPDGYSELLANSLSASQQTQLEQLVANAALTCRTKGAT